VRPFGKAEREKRAVAEAAADLVPPGSRIGLGTGSTVAYFLPALARRRIKVRCVATSPATERAARALGLVVEPFDELPQLDIAVDGADQVAPDGWLVKGGGGAHTREKRVAEAAARLVVIVSSDKLVSRLHPPIPLELRREAAETALNALRLARLREAPTSPDGGLIADYYGPVTDPEWLSALLASVAGVVEHGLFPPNLVSEVLVARGGAVERAVDRRFRRFESGGAALA
jgi:ribose 5-phosphate isomerase A